MIIVIIYHQNCATKIASNPVNLYTFSLLSCIFQFEFCFYFQNMVHDYFFDLPFIVKGKFGCIFDLKLLDEIVEF